MFFEEKAPSVQGHANTLWRRAASPDRQRGL
jgi:hypothetical protein